LREKSVGTAQKNATPLMNESHAELHHGFDGLTLAGLTLAH
jgi:hypothetical protein